MHEGQRRTVALAVAACQAGFSIYFTTLDDMVRHLTAADAIGRLARKLQTYLRPTVLVIDEVGTVRDVVILESPSDDLSAAAIDAIEAADYPIAVATTASVMPT
mgnify:CR=1 FL=1